MLLLVLGCVSGQAQKTADDIFAQFKEAEGVQSITLPDSLFRSKIQAAMPDSMSAEDAKKLQAITRIGEIKILAIEGENAGKLIGKIGRCMDKLLKKGYEVLVSTNNEDESVRVLTRMEGENLREMLVWQTEKDDDEMEGHLVLMSGNFSRGDMQTIIENCGVSIDTE